MTLAGAATGRNASATLTSFERRFEIVDVALEFGLARIGDRADADGLDRGRDAFAGIELGIEFGEMLAIDAAGERILAPGLIGRRSKPLKRSSTYCDQEIDLPNSPSLTTSMPDFGLLAHDLGDRVRQALARRRPGRTACRPAWRARNPAAPADE